MKTLMSVSACLLLFGTLPVEAGDRSRRSFDKIEVNVSEHQIQSAPHLVAPDSETPSFGPRRQF
jgi:hypothetical protein